MPTDRDASDTNHQLAPDTDTDAVDSADTDSYAEVPASMFAGITPDDPSMGIVAPVVVGPAEFDAIDGLLVALADLEDSLAELRDEITRVRAWVGEVRQVRSR